MRYRVPTCFLQSGQLYAYVVSVPAISAAWGSTLAYCISLQEVLVVDTVNKGTQARIVIATEPAFIALGPYHIAVGMNNKVKLPSMAHLHGQPPWLTSMANLHG